MRLCEVEATNCFTETWRLSWWQRCCCQKHHRGCCLDNLCHSHWLYFTMITIVIRWLHFHQVTFILLYYAFIIIWPVMVQHNTETKRYRHRLHHLIMYYNNSSQHRFDGGPILSHRVMFNGVLQCYLITCQQSDTCTEPVNLFGLVM